MTRTARVLTSLVVVASCAMTGAASSASPAELDVKTLVVVPGGLSAFAQDGPRLAWARGGYACGSRIGLYDLRTRRISSLEQKNGPGCTNRYERIHVVAIAGRRVVWDVGSASNTEFATRYVTAATTDRRNRIVGALDVFGEGMDWPVGPLAAGDGSIELFHAPNEVRALAAGRGRRLFPVDVPDPASDTAVASDTYPRVRGLAVAGGLTAVLEDLHPCACFGGPEWSPDGTKIAWSRQGTIYAMNADGTGKRRISPAGADGSAAEGPAWSPDGSRLAYAYRGAERSPWQVHLVGADGTGHSVLTVGEHPRWAPAEQELSFVRGGDVWKIRADGGSVTRLTNDGLGAAAGAEWSPDGSRLAAARGIGSANGLYVIAADASGQTRISSGATGRARWSPTGDRIAFGGSVVNTDGSGLHKLTANAYDEYPAWSPDGARIAFQREDPDEQQRALRVFVVSASGGTARAVTPTEVRAAYPAWSPNGDTFAFTRVADENQVDSVNRRSAGIYRIAADGSALWKLAPDDRAGVDIRDARTGARLAAFTVAGEASAIALSRGYLAVLAGGRLDVFRPRTGAPVASIALPAKARSLAVSEAGIAVFQVGGELRAFDTETGVIRTIARAVAPPVSLCAEIKPIPRCAVGLSFDGNRLAWAENRGKHAVIRAVELPSRLR